MLGWKFNKTNPIGISLQLADEWLAGEAHQGGIINLRMHLNEGEKRLGLEHLLVDGYNSDRKAVYEFHSCCWHGHWCWMAEKKFMGVDAKFVELMQKREKRIDEKMAYLEIFP